MNQRLPNFFPKLALLGFGAGLALLSACSPSPQQKAPSPIPPEAVVFQDLQVKSALSPQAGDAQRGAQIMVTRKLGNCVACHQVTALQDEAPFHGEIGPSLDGAGLRWKQAQLRGLLVNPKKYFPQTVMPAYYRSQGLTRVRPEFAGKTILTAQQIEDVVAFLQTLK